MAVFALIGVAALVGYRYRSHFHSTSVTTLVRQANPLATSVACMKDGIMAFAGTSTTVHDCNLVFPGADVWRCYVRVKGDLYEVTEQVKAIAKVEPGSGSFNCARPQ